MLRLLDLFCDVVPTLRLLRRAAFSPTGVDDDDNADADVDADVDVYVVIEGHISLARVRHKIKIQINDRVEPIHDRTDVILILLRNRGQLKVRGRWRC